jgi:hypothetical protein
MKVRKCTRIYRNQTFMLMPLAKMRNLGVSLPERLEDQLRGPVEAYLDDQYGKKTRASLTLQLRTLTSGQANNSL